MGNFAAMRAGGRHAVKNNASARGDRDLWLSPCPPAGGPAVSACTCEKRKLMSAKRRGLFAACGIVDRQVRRGQLLVLSTGAERKHRGFSFR